MKQIMTFLIAGILFAYGADGNAETLYVGDTLRVGVRANQNDNSAQLTVITSGSAFEVLERAGNHMKIRTQSGVEGWIKSVYASSDKPAAVLLKEAQSALAQLRAQGTDAVTATSPPPIAADDATIKENAALKRELEQSREENKQLRTQMQSTRISADTQMPQPSPFETAAPSTRAMILYIAGGLVLCFAMGFLLGVSWHRGQVSKRLGGFSL